MTNWELATENAERMLEEYRRRCRLGPTEYPAHWVGFDIYREFMQELLDAKDKERDAAIAEAVGQRTVECAGICTTKYFASDAARDILALNAPPALLWQHKSGCPTPFQWNAKLQRWALPDKVDGITECTHKSWHYCPSCGAPRPTTKGN